MSTDAAKEFADAVPLRFTVSDQKRGLPPGALQSRFLVRRASDKPLRRHAFLRHRSDWQTAEPMRGIFNSWLGGTAFPLSLVVQLSLLPRKPSNVRGCGILMMYRLPARLSLIVVRRMSFVDQYFLGASGCRGVVRCLHMAWAWPARGLSRGRAGDAAEASIGRALPALLGAHVLHVLRGALF